MLSAKDVKSETDVTDERRRPEDGIYHLIVEEVNATYEKPDPENAIEIGFRILAGAPAGQEDLTFSHRIYLDKKTNSEETDKHLRFALASQLIDPGEEKDVDWNDAVGKQLIASVENNVNESTGKTYTNIAEWGMALWRTGHPEVTDVPKDKRALAQAGTAPTPPADTASGDEFGDL